MSSIPPHIAAALFQAQVASQEAAKPGDAQRNKRARDARQLARLADQHQQEVEDTTEIELLKAERFGYRPHDHQPKKGQDQDIYEHAEDNSPPPSDAATDRTASQSPDNQDRRPPHIDLTA